MGVGKFEQIWARVVKRGQVWIGLNDQAEMGEKDSGWVWICMQV